MKDDFALIIGVNDYIPPLSGGLRALKGAIYDANEFESWVKNPSGGNIPNANCFKIISTANPLMPIQDLVDATFEKMINLIENNGGNARRLYFYFAGHGLGTLDNVTDTALCLAKWSRVRRNTALSSEKYKDTMRQYGYFEEIIFITDCCRNVQINVKPMHPTFAPLMPKPEAGETKIFAGYATQYQDQAYEIEAKGSDKRGVFTKVLINGLKGAAANENGIVNADSLRDYLIKETPIEAQKEGYKQIPEIFHSFTSTIPIVTLPNVQNKEVSCHITFNDQRNSIIELIDNSGNIITFDASQKKHQILLKKGLYLLRDSETDEKYPIQVSSSNKELHVIF